MTGRACAFLALLVFPELRLCTAEAESVRRDFRQADDLAGLDIHGDACITDDRPEVGTALRVGPGDRVVWRLRDGDGGGSVRFRVFDDQTAPEEPEKRSAGPRWGLISAGGHLLTVGALYAPYLNGAETYAVCDHGPSEFFLSRVQYLGLRRDMGWHEWTFKFDPEAGLSILHNGEDVNSRRIRFDWNQTKMPGFVGVVFVGDSATSRPQTAWIDAVEVQLAGPMTVGPVLPTPPPPVTPESDPDPEDVPAVVETTHPRLLFSADDIPALRRRARGVGSQFVDDMTAYLPSCRAPEHRRFLRDATDGQRQGLWRMPTVALHYVLTRDAASFDAAVGFLELMLSLDHWEEGKEQDCGMSSANIMIGVALTYDMLYGELPADLCEKARQKLLLMARRQYYRGHLAKAKGIHYWQNDPANNHRWHRNAGLALATLAVAGDGPGDEWLRGKVLDELRFVHRWLPQDGSGHESPSYLVFGLPHLVLAFDASDRVLGTDLMQHEFFRRTPYFRLHTLTPGFQSTFAYGDSAENSFGGYHAALWRCLQAVDGADVHQAMQGFMAAQRQAFDFGWWNLVWYRPAVGEGSIDGLGPVCLFPDVGLACMRDGWREDSVALVFKCGPYGGHELNGFRNADRIALPGPVGASGRHRYINVAHDDPDAGTFMVYAGGRILAKSDGYAYMKLTSSHNSILVNGRGQKGEGQHWTQPLRNYDMTELARITTWKRTSSNLVVVEGEASGAYGTGRPTWDTNDLDLFRRSVVWFPGNYILLLDTIRAQAGVAVKWMLQGRTVEATAGRSGSFVMRDGKASMQLQIASEPVAAAVTVAESSADHRSKTLGLEQLQLDVSGKSIRIASLLNPWRLRGLRVELGASANGASVTVIGPDFIDVWAVSTPAETRLPSGIQGSRDGRLLVAVDASACVDGD